MDIHKKQGGMPIVNETRLTIDTRDSWVVTVQFVAPALREYDIVHNEKKNIAGLLTTFLWTSILMCECLYDLNITF